MLSYPTEQWTPDDWQEYAHAVAEILAGHAHEEQERLAAIEAKMEQQAINRQKAGLCTCERVQITADRWELWHVIGCPVHGSFAGLNKP